MRKGFTTGTAATCASVAHAIYKLRDEKVDFVNVVLPNNDLLKINVEVHDDYAFVIKDSGDDPDVTNGAKICACVELDFNNKEILIQGGKGVGVVTKEGLQIPVGKAAINPVPIQMIKNNLNKIVGNKIGAKVTIFVPDGEKIAEKTFNKRIGIVGGISIIGTTGIVEPMSVDAVIATIKCEIDVLLKNNSEIISLVPGKIGEKHLKSLYPEKQPVIVSNYFGEAFSYLRENDLSEILIAGHPGKTAKLAMGYYNTHSKNSPQATDFVAEKLGLDKKFNTVEEICNICENFEFNKIAKLISDKVKADYGFTIVSVILFDMKGNLKGMYEE